MHRMYQKYDLLSNLRCHYDYLRDKRFSKAAAPLRIQVSPIRQAYFAYRPRHPADQRVDTQNIPTNGTSLLEEVNQLPKMELA